MKNIIYLTLLSFMSMGCTQIITAPISVAGTLITTTLDVAGSAGAMVVKTIAGTTNSKTH